MKGITFQNLENPIFFFLITNQYSKGEDMNFIGHEKMDLISDITY